MARTRFSVSTDGEIAIAAATAKTVLQILSPTNIGVAIRGLAISFDGVSGAAEPGSVELVIQTSAGTSLVAATPVHDDRRVTLTIQTTALKGASGAQTEPTDGGVVPRDWHVHPQTGVEFRWWLDEELILGSAQRCGVRVIQPAIVNCRARLFCEE